MTSKMIRKVLIQMSIYDTLRMAIGNLLRRKLRTFLTILGVVIGTTSIIVMVSIGIGINESYKQQISEWGSLQVIEVYKPYSYDGNASGQETKLTDETIHKFRDMEGVETATPVLNQYFQLICGKYVVDASFKGINLDSMEAMGYEIVEGRLPNSDDRFGIAVGQSLLTQFYNPKLSWRMRYNSPSPEVNIFEDRVKITYDWSWGTSNADKKIKPYNATVVGVVGGSGEESYSVIMDIKDLQKIVDDQNKYYNNKNNTSKGEYQNALVKVADMNDVSKIEQQIKDMGFNTYSLMQYLESMQETTNMLQAVLGVIGAVSLLVAAIGITNTMIMSIYERTREIGVMKVIGASLMDIQKLFLTEAAFIGFFGGLFGIILSFIISFGINSLGAGYFGGGYSISVIPLWLSLLGLGFATLIGIIAGFFPARRATKLSALTAIKTE